MVSPRKQLSFTWGWWSNPVGMVGSSPWMPHPSAAQLVFFHLVRPVPSLSGRNWRWTASPFKQGQLCGAEIALLRVKMLPDMKKRSLLAGTEVFAPVYELTDSFTFVHRCLVVVVATTNPKFELYKTAERLTALTINVSYQDDCDSHVK